MLKEVVVQLIVDHREAPSGLIDELTDYSYETQEARISTNVEVATLPVGDVVCSDRVGVERKSVADYVDTFVNSRRALFTQAFDLKNAYSHGLMILEGDSIQGIRNVHPEALRASVAALAVGMRLPIVPTRNVEETAAYLVTIAKREQFKTKRSVSIHGKRSHMSLAERKLYVVSSIGEGVGPTMARALLARFGSVQAVMSASVEELTTVKGVGTKIAEKIRAIVGGGKP